ncbi:predicted protein [Thalassiosira pseudonana CCMP1335]|uniref:Armadillo repeat-containing domain-containing protein n=1 Tax=Thalassiosira pseudonana TaxID=35128 RepID=B8CAP8_THAPS|nr:predicted protein [Thalassiosira pseudonana CCMP1335]EED89719.1 predicted protein [Thalassiosira pseudonana CCMP1335]
MLQRCDRRNVDWRSWRNMHNHIVKESIAELCQVPFRKKKSPKNVETTTGKDGDAANSPDAKVEETQTDPKPVPVPSEPPKMDLRIFFNQLISFPIFQPKPAPVPSKPPQMEDISDLLKTMMTEKGEKSAAATKRIYELCDVGHKQNRVPMVCSGKHDILTPLAQCLTQESGGGRFLACLALNNLSIPMENKRVMALGPSSSAVIGGLCKVIAEEKHDFYLCCICLMNLSFLEANITTMLQHSPVAEGSDPVAPLDNPESLIRILEKPSTMLLRYQSLDLETIGVIKPIMAEGDLQ